MHRSSTQAGRARGPRDAGCGLWLEDQVGFLLRCAHQRATEVFNAVMGALRRHADAVRRAGQARRPGPVSQNQLGRLTAHGPGDHLRRDRPADRARLRAASRPTSRMRALVMLTLTPAGQAAVTAMKAVAAEVSRATLEPLTAAEAAALLKRARQDRVTRCSPPPSSSSSTGDRLHLSHGPIDVVLKAWGSRRQCARAYAAAGRALPGRSCPSCATSWPSCAAPIQERAARSTGPVARRMVAALPSLRRRVRHADGGRRRRRRRRAARGT